MSDMHVSDLKNHLRDPARLSALQAVALLDTPAEEAFDRLSRLAARLLEVPVALVSLVDADRQFFKSCIGLQAEPWASDRETPLSHSFCQHNRVADQPLVVKDARLDPVFSSNLAVRDLDVIAYLGFPLTTTDGYVLGSFCAIDSKPRDWAAADIEIIRDLAASVMVEIQLRTEIANRSLVEGERDNLNELNEQLRSEVAARKLAEQQQHQLEAQLQQTHKIEAIGQLAGGIAHDLNNLLAPILIYTSILLDDESLRSHHHDQVDQIQNAGLRARDLLRKLLTFSRLQAMQFEVQDLNAIVGDIEKLLRRTIPEDIDFKLTLGDDVAPILADMNQVEQIVMNLVVNAADAMPNGGELHIHTGIAKLEAADIGANADAEPGLFATLSISDSGVGMDDTTKEHLFEPFFSTKNADGNGLGLATVMGIVLDHRGVIKFSSDPGQGTTFRVYLPVTDQPVRPDETGNPRPSGVRGVVTILVAEDDDQVREVTERILQERGYNVLTAKDGSDALSILTSYAEPVHLLLTDVVMPNMNGRELFEAAQEGHPDLDVLFMSGYSEDIISHRGVLESGIRFIAKPFMGDELLAQINEILMLQA